MDLETAKWVIMIMIGVVGFFLKSLHDKVQQSVAREEFNSAMETLRKEHNADRQELRDNQIKLFEKLDIQQQLLTQVATKIAVMVEMGKFGNPNDSGRFGHGGGQ